MTDFRGFFRARNLRNAPDVEVLPVIRVAFLRGKGEREDDPVREVSAYYRAADGAFLFELDPHTATPPRNWL